MSLISHQMVLVIKKICFFFNYHEFRQLASSNKKLVQKQLVRFVERMKHRYVNTDVQAVHTSSVTGSRGPRLRPFQNSFSDNPFALIGRK
jgi:hypothetical protein